VSRLALSGAAMAMAAGAGLTGLALALGASDQPAAAVAIEVAAAIAVSTIAAFVILFPLGRAIGHVAVASRRLASGVFGERVPMEPGPAGELTTAFNVMSRRVQELFDTVTAEHARLEAVFDASSDAMVALSRDTAVRFMNAAAVAVFETSFQAALGRPFIETVRDYELDALVRRSVDAAGGETAVITFGARRVPLRAAALPIPGGGDWAILLTLTDLTEVNRVDQVRRDFLGNVSHELRTPLASIRALAETMVSGAVDPGPDTTAFSERILQQAVRLTTLVNELLDLSRIESGAIELHPEQLDLAALAGEAASLMRERSDAKQTTFDLPAIPGAVVEADRSSILRAVTNLLDNAIKYSPPGSTVYVSTADEDGLAALAVRDEGPGIAVQDLPRVFERFYKGDSSRAEGGVGLGLAIVKHVVRIHGGTVDVQSTPGSGATFTLRLPKAFVGPGPRR
jgi:two-component system phosphate regulon sensor histidine kinase PhoR